jgi:hypothetical protein
MFVWNFILSKLLFFGFESCRFASLAAGFGTIDRWRAFVQNRDRIFLFHGDFLSLIAAVYFFLPLVYIAQELEK